MEEVDIQSGSRKCVNCGSTPIWTDEELWKCFQCNKKMVDIDVPEDTHIWIEDEGYAVWTEKGSKKHILQGENSLKTVCGETRGEAVHEWTDPEDDDICRKCTESSLRR